MEKLPFLCPSWYLVDIPSATMKKATDPEPNAEDYLRLLAENDSSIAAYVHTLVRSTSDAEDILQECKILMWKKFADFQPGSNFLAWARRIALNLVLNYRRKIQKAPTTMDQKFFESIAEEIDRRLDQLDERAEALQYCLSKLPLPHRQVILLRYYDDLDIAGIARKVERSEGAVYRLLSRIRGVLNDCVSQQIANPSST